MTASGTCPFLAEGFRHFISRGITVSQACANRGRAVRWKNWWLFLWLLVQVRALLFNWCPIYCWCVALFCFFFSLCLASVSRKQGLVQRSVMRLANKLRTGALEDVWNRAALPVPRLLSLPPQQLSLTASGCLVRTYWRWIFPESAAPPPDLSLRAVDKSNFMLHSYTPCPFYE